MPEAYDIDPDEISTLFRKLGDEQRAVQEAQRLISQAIRNLVHEEHVHSWEVPGIYAEPKPLHPRLNWDKTTIVLLRCKGCGYLTTERLDGIWTIEQVRGEYDEDTDPA